MAMDQTHCNNTLLIIDATDNRQEDTELFFTSLYTRELQL
jgi:hypothetical protein